MKVILSEIVDRLSDTAASLDALELLLVEGGVLRNDAIHNRFKTHKGTVEEHLIVLRSRIAGLTE
jgi:hypothetical protein